MQHNDTPQSDLSEMTATFRLLSLDKRKQLMDFIIQEREHGVFYLHKEIMYPFLSEHCVNPLDGNALILFSEKIKHYANILVDLPQEELDTFSQSIQIPDTEKETQQKAKRHKKIKKMALKLHKRHQKRGNIFSRILKKAGHFTTALFSRQINETNKRTPQLNKTKEKNEQPFSLTHLVKSLFSRQILESEKLGLDVFTEKDFDKALENALQPEKNEELEFITMIKQSNMLSSKLLAHAILSIEKGDFNIQKTDENGDTLLHIAVQKKGMEKLVVALLNNGGDLTAVNNAGQTPVNLAHCEKMHQALKMFNIKKEDLSQKKVAYFQQLVENEKIIPISQNDMSERFPTPIITVQDILNTPKTDTLKHSEKFADNALPYIDETGNKITFIHPSEQKIAEHPSKQLLQQQQSSMHQENQNS